MMNNRISVYVRNSEHCPSCYYRVIQYLKKLNYNFEVKSLLNNKEYRLNLDMNNEIFKKIYQFYLYIKIVFKVLVYICEDLIRKPKIIIIQRSMLPKHMPLVIYILLKKVLNSSKLFWDFDDNIFLNKEISNLEAKLLGKLSTLIITTNVFLKNQLPEIDRQKVYLIPTTDGELTEAYNHSDILDKRKKTFLHDLKFVWVGTSSNLEYVKSIIDEIEKFALFRYNLDNNNKTTFIIVCNKPLNYNSKHLIISNVNWSRNNAYHEMIKAHVGIMPLIENNYTLGKGAFKLIQYISLGLPVLASNVGFNKEVVSQSFGFLIQRPNLWLRSMKRITSDIQLWESMSLKAYENWNFNFSFDSNLKFWNDNIRNYL